MLGNRKTRPTAGGGDIVKKTSKTTATKDQNGSKNIAAADKNAVGKRLGEKIADPAQKKRAAFGDITNALADKTNIKVALKKSRIPSSTCGQKPAVIKPGKESKPKKEGAAKAGAKVKAGKSTTKEVRLDDGVISLTQESLISSGSSTGSQSSSQESVSSVVPALDDCVLSAEEPKIPEDVDDVDKENMQDPVQAALYAQDIFSYYKDRELLFHVKPYMSSQKFLTSNMRSILVDWMVEVQENFEMNHETLYLATKLVDMYVSRREVAKETLQLVGAGSLFIAAKFDERCPPLVEDFLYICDDAYKKTEFLEMERCILKAVDFDIGMPLSYRFLRRYAKCARAPMETLTLARYILEMSLMEYDFVSRRESEMAAASLLLALRMKKVDNWSATMVYYTGYHKDDLIPLARKLNSYIKSPPKQLTTVQSKYSHKVFYEVAKTPVLSDEELV